MAGCTRWWELPAAMLAVSVVLTTVNALARSFFHMNFPWVEELCCYLAALMMFVMMPSLEFRDEQLSISFLDEKFKNNQVARQILFYIRGIVTVIFTGILINGGYKVVVRNLEIHSASPILRNALRLAVRNHSGHHGAGDCLLGCPPVYQ